MSDLLARVEAMAAKSKAAPDKRREVIARCPALVAWLGEWQVASGEKARLLRAFDGTGWEYRA